MNITFTGISTKLSESLRSELKYEWSKSEPGGSVALNVTLRPGETLIVHHSMLCIAAKDGQKFAIDRLEFREVEIL